MTANKTGAVLKGRGSVSNTGARFLEHQREVFDDGWGVSPQAGQPVVRTQVRPERARTLITRNASPDVPFDRSVNPYRGCEHGCIYCYARPDHARLGLSPGLDFESRLTAKANAAQVLEAELARPGYRAAVLALGTSTDPYQPVERQWGITRQLLSVLLQCRHPVSITTKSAGILRDLDLLTALARQDLVRVFISVCTLDGELARTLEPRAGAPQARLDAIRRLSAAGIPVGVLVAPVIPALTDDAIERVVAAAAAAGAQDAHYVLLRLPGEVAPLFQEWLQVHAPGRMAHVLKRLREMRGGRLNDAAFGTRMRGQGVHAALIGQRFRKACTRHGLAPRRIQLNTALFRPPGLVVQRSLFDEQDDAGD
ncbi:MAG: PA0069 family radical SAM protein [Castellaniella sp.]